MQKNTPSLAGGLTPGNPRAGRLAISRTKKKEKKGKGTENNQGKSAGKGGWKGGNPISA